MKEKAFFQSKPRKADEKAEVWMKLRRMYELLHGRIGS